MPIDGVVKMPLQASIFTPGRIAFSIDGAFKNATAHKDFTSGRRKARVYREEQNMKSIIRIMTEKDKSDILEMMRVFYTSPAVSTNGSEEIFLSDIENCINDNPYLEGYVFEDLNDIQGYAMVAKSFSTEFGKECIWIEDLYIKEACRGLGIGKMFLEYITQKYTDCIFRLEVEEENERAIALYKKCGFSLLPYLEMKK